MDAVLLAAGKGTRLRPLTVNRPKPLVPVANRPVMEYQLRLLEKAGFERVIIPLGYLGEQIASYAESFESELKFEFSFENIPLGTAGAVAKLRDRLDGTFLIISGDLLVDVDVSDLMDFHRRMSASVSIALTRVEDPTQYGIALLEGSRISTFAEKPDPSKVFSNLINAGIYVMEPEVLDEVPPNAQFDFSLNLFPSIIDRRYVAGYLMEGYWNDIGRPSSYLQANGDALLGRFPLDKFVREPTLPTKVTPVMGRSSTVGDVDISGPVLLGENCLVEGGSALRSFVVLGDNVSVGKDSVLDSVVVHRGTRIGSSANVRHCIIGRGCVISEDVQLAEGTVIGDETRIGQGCRIGANMKIWAGSTLGPNTIIMPD